MTTKGFRTLMYSIGLFASGHGAISASAYDSSFWLPFVCAALFLVLLVCDAFSEDY